MSTSLLQWNRVCQVIVGDAGTGVLVEPPLKIEFNVKKTVGRTPNTCLLKLYNLSPDTENRIKGEYTEVILNAGYEGSAGLLFRGNIRHTFAYRDGNDRIVEIDAADGDRDFQRSTVNTTLAAGTSTADLIAHVLGTFKSTVRGHITLKDRKRIRGRVVSGMARDVLDDVAAESGANWSIQDGALHIVPTDGYLPTEAVVLTSETGLLGAPEIDDKGIKVRCLLNSKIAVNGKVWLDNNDIKLKVKKQHESKPGAHAKTPKHKAAQVARLDPDGIYKVIEIEYRGDTRGRDWFCDLRCLGLDKAIPATASAK